MCPLFLSRLRQEKILSPIVFSISFSPTYFRIFTRIISRYIFFGAVLKGVASHPIHPPPLDPPLHRMCFRHLQWCLHYGLNYPLEFGPFSGLMDCSQNLSEPWKLLFSWNFYHGECLVLLDFLQFSCFDDGSLGPGCTSTVISCCVYNLLLALDFLLRSLSLQGLWEGCQPMLTVSWSEIVHPVMERSRSHYASAVLFLYPCLQFCLCSSWMSKLQGSFSPCLFQPRVRSCTQHSLWIFSASLLRVLKKLFQCAAKPFRLLTVFILEDV